MIYHGLVSNLSEVAQLFIQLPGRGPLIRDTQGYLRRDQWQFRHRHGRDERRVRVTLPVANCTGVLLFVLRVLIPARSSVLQNGIDGLEKRLAVRHPVQQDGFVLNHQTIAERRHAQWLLFSLLSEVGGRQQHLHLWPVLKQSDTTPSRSLDRGQ